MACFIKIDRASDRYLCGRGRMPEPRGNPLPRRERKLPRSAGARRGRPAAEARVAPRAEPEAGAEGDALKARPKGEARMAESRRPLPGTPSSKNGIQDMDHLALPSDRLSAIDEAALRSCSLRCPVTRRSLAISLNSIASSKIRNVLILAPCPTGRARGEPMEHRGYFDSRFGRLTNSP